MRMLKTATEEVRVLVREPQSAIPTDEDEAAGLYRLRVRERKSGKFHKARRDTVIDSPRSKVDRRRECGYVSAE